MAYGRYQGRYGGGGQTSQGMGSGPIFAIGLIMLAVGALVVVHALVGGVRLPPASAQQIPATVSTAVPFPVDPSKVAPPLPPSTPVLIEIPAVAVEAPVMRLGRNSDGTVQVPPLDDHNLAGWYDGSPMPGQKGSSVVLGHVDNYAGPSVFFSIKALRRGDHSWFVVLVGRAGEDKPRFVISVMMSNNPLLRAKAVKVVEAELARLGGRVGQLDDRAHAEIAQAMHRVVDKLLHAPTVRVKELAGSPGGDSYETALRVLFDLDPGAVEAVTRADAELVTGSPAPSAPPPEQEAR